MANKQALRDLQTRLAERMQQVRTETPGVSWLAVDCAGQGLLLSLKQAGEIFDLGPLVAVPHTQPWLAGVVCSPWSTWRASWGCARKRRPHSCRRAWWPSMRPWASTVR